MLAMRDILKGYRPGRIQRVANMAVAPIITETPFSNVGGTGNVYMANDKSYETMQFANEGDKIGVVPQGYMVMQHKTGAQDRAVPSFELVKSKGKKDVNVKCVQSGQGGHFGTQKDDRDWQFLPLSLRARAYRPEQRKSKEFGSLWDEISTFNVAAGTSSGSHIEYFYKQFSKDLDTFVAQFELVANQVGAMVFINDELRAIEVMPNEQIWAENFHRLVRYCYGADAVAVREMAVDLFQPKLENGRKVKDREGLSTALDRMLEVDRQFVSSTYASTADRSFNDKVNQRVDHLSVVDFGGSSEFIGQGVLHGDDHYVYASLISTKPYERKKLRPKALDDNPYSGEDFAF